MRSLSRALPVENLPNIPYTLPRQQAFQAESSGAFRKEWLRGLPAYRKMAENARYLPSHEDFWKASPSQAVSIISSRMNYHDILHSAALDGIMPIEALLRSPGAPTPDIIYEDIMRWKTFDRIQKPPEEQFVLETNVLQQLLAQCAHLVMVDPDYFARAELFFRKIEQQQNIGAAAYSCWALMCTASGRISLGLEVLAFMDRRGMAFDQHVFVLCMNPGASDFQTRIRGGEKSSKGFVRQLRLLNRLTVSVDTEHMSSIAGIHAFFVMFNLTLNHVRKWELIRTVVQDTRFLVSKRTVLYLIAMLDVEGARRCGSLTVQALLILFAQHGDFAACLQLLSRVRQNEAIEAHNQMCPVVVMRKETIREVEHYLTEFAEPVKDNKHVEPAAFDDEIDDTESIRSFSDIIEAVRARKALRPVDYFSKVKQSQAQASTDKKVMGAWISFLMRIRENGVHQTALERFVNDIGLFGNNNTEKVSLLEAMKNRALSNQHSRSVQQSKSQTATRREFLGSILEVQPLKPLRVPLKKHTVTVSPKIPQLAKPQAKLSQETKQKGEEKKQRIMETVSPVSSSEQSAEFKDTSSQKAEIPQKPDVPKPTAQKMPSQNSHQPQYAQTDSPKPRRKEQPSSKTDNQAEEAPSRKVRPFPKIHDKTKNYVEDIPATNNPFEQDEERKALMERARKRQETQADIDTSQNKQAMDQLFQREKERMERIARIPQAWTLS